MNPQLIGTLYAWKFSETISTALAKTNISHWEIYFFVQNYQTLEFIPDEIVTAANSTFFKSLFLKHYKKRGDEGV